MTTTDPAQLVPPVDGLDLLVDGGEFLLVRIKDHGGERIRIGIQDSAVRLLLAVRPRVNRAKFFAVLAGVIATVALVFLVPAGIGLPPLLGLAMATSVGLVGLVVVLMFQPTREYRFHDDLPGGLDRAPLMVLAERNGQQSWYALRDEQERMFGDVARRLGRWRVRGFEPIDPPPPTEEEAAAAAAAELNGLAAKLYSVGMSLSEDEPTPAGPTPEVSVMVVRDYLNLASLLAGLISGPVGIVMAFNGPWKRMEFRRGRTLVATGHRLDDGGAMRLEIAEGLDQADNDDVWLDRRHVLALAVLSLSLEAER
ncbi:MAG: hypothetical protein NCW75_00955 [Phycisphaera sp.]|nr:MAG: hypothetical protein NCW75_00955 [Phycisphaera sp.]